MVKRSGPFDCAVSSGDLFQLIHYKLQLILPLNSFGFIYEYRGTNVLLIIKFKGRALCRRTKSDVGHMCTYSLRWSQQMTSYLV
jgi:hypothetical protein